MYIFNNLNLSIFPSRYYATLNTFVTNRLLIKIMNRYESEWKNMVEILLYLFSNMECFLCMCFGFFISLFCLGFFFSHHHA